jgi:2-oxo-3-hexenedioate decarboxylase
MDATEVAAELARLHESAATSPPFSGRDPGLTPAGAYAAARKLHARRLAEGWRPVGRKIGFTNRGLWPRYGVSEPIWGTVYDRTLVTAPEGRATVALARLAQPRIEPEIAFGLRSAPPRDGDPEALLDALGWIAHAVEIVQCHHPGWKFALADCIADNALHGRLVLGPALEVRAVPGLAGVLPGVEVTLRRGAGIVDRGRGANVLGSPLLAVAHLVETLARQRGAPPLAAGEIVTTGVLTDAHPVAPGERWSTAFAGIALVGLEIDFA